MRTRLHVPCRVCGSPGAGNHYGGLVCSCCRIFFIRHARRTKLVPCRSSRSCVMRPAAHDNCQGCRFKKCIEAGMNPAEVGSHRERHLAPSYKSNDPQESLELIREVPVVLSPTLLQYTSQPLPDPEEALWQLEKAFQQVNGMFQSDGNQHLQYLLAETIINARNQYPQHHVSG